MVTWYVVFNVPLIVCIPLFQVLFYYYYFLKAAVHYTECIEDCILRAAVRFLSVFHWFLTCTYSLVFKHIDNSLIIALQCFETEQLVRRILYEKKKSPQQYVRKAGIRVGQKCENIPFNIFHNIIEKVNWFQTMYFHLLVLQGQRLYSLYNIEIYRSTAGLD